MAFDPLHFRFTQAAIGSPEDDAATATEAAVAQLQLSQVALLKGILIAVGASSGVTVSPSFTDDAAFTPGTTKVMPVAGTYRATRDVLDDGDAGAVALNARRGQFVTLETVDSTPLALSVGSASASTLRMVTASDSPDVTLLTTMNATLSTLNLSTDGLEAALGIITETAPATDTASSGLNGRLQRIAQRITSLIAQIPATLGVKARTGSLSVALSTEDVALLPASLGSKAAASSFAVTDSTEDIARIGIVTETAPASDTASSGLNGRLQRIAQRLTSLIALVPASLGQKAMSASFAVTLASDDPLSVLQSASSASVTALASSASSAQLLAANTARKGLILNNTDANAVLVKYGTTASATSFTVRIPLNGYWEMPKPIYTGRIDAIWEADGSGSLYATEM
jgi:hypothetical protein